MRELRREDQPLLEQFFLSLSDETVTWQNHFGKVNEPMEARAQSLYKRNEFPDIERGYIAIEFETIIAYGWLSFGRKPTQKYTCSLGLVVADSWQRKGIGRDLTEYMIEQARNLGMRKIWLNVYKDNKKALRLYQSLGFKVEGLFKMQEWTVKDDKPLDLYSMALLFR